MDNPQHYQPLSHALNPPIVQPQYEEEEEGEDEGAVEEQLEREDDDGDESNRTNQQPPSANGAGKQRAEPGPSIPPQPSGPPTSEDVERKRRPGRPRGSKNRRIRGSGAERDASATSTAAAKHATTTHGFYQYSAPPAPGEVHPHNQQYYEFQWRVLNLCAEFYGAAEELIKATPSLVIAQCYQMGPGVKVDPLTMLGEAKRICDTLLASPARLTAHPPPVPYPFIPGYTPLAPQPPQPPLQSTPPPSANGKPSGATQSAAPVISNPQSFVVSMGHQHPTPQQFVPGMYSAPTYPTAPYYGYGGYSSFYPSVPAPQAGPSPSTGSNGSAGPIPGSAGNQGAWSDEETEKLKKLAEEHRNASGEIAWDALCEKWGNSRTRHQILIKATSLGLKESSSRGTKRRRDTESQTSSDRPAPSAPTPGAENPIPTPALTSAPPPPQSAAPMQQNTHPPAPPSQTVPPNSVQPSASPAPSTPATSTQPSPAIRHAQTQQQAPASRNFPYPMPTVAAATSPVISTAPQQPQERSGSTSTYYRRVNPPAGSPSHAQGVTTHQYMYQPNGRREN
ncbi:hypothetical protein J3R82DRAFT_11947 [Butyriboletus roseoflavus]|nr:hypothetical protein J3R82DRAFT_11947 [Butyriboletus roseoflavus]